MKIYEKETMEEWSRKLRCRYGNRFRMYSTHDETLERWHEHLSHLLGYKFIIRKNEYETLEEWSKLIGG
jgi:hypothetical protein